MTLGPPVMEAQRDPEQDRLTDMLTCLRAVVRKHPPEDQALFQEMIVLALTTDEPVVAQDAIRTAVEILRDNEDETAETAKLILPPIGKEQPPQHQPLKAWTEHVAGRIKRLRDGKGWTQEQLAEEAGLTQSHISRIEKGVHSPSWKTITKIAKALGVSPGDLDPTVD